jgi:phage terminase large subunit
MLQETTAQIKISKLNKRVRVVRGGTSASKTFSIIPFLIDYAVKNPKCEISVVAETIPHLRRGALRDFLKIMDMIGMYKEEQYNRSSLIYTFKNGSYIEFFSADNSSKLRGARRDVLFINECNNVSWDSYYQLAIRTRKFIYLDYNPTEEFWVDSELLNTSDKDVQLLVLTYKDNEALEPSIVKEIEKARDKAATSDYWRNWYNVYGLGQIGKVDGLVFTDWSQVETIPPGAKYIGTGMDFGFTNDPTTVIDVYSQDGKLIIDEVVYETGLTNQAIYNRLKDEPRYKQKYIIADSAEPKSIAELQAMGLSVLGADKTGGINSTIDVLQRYHIQITQRSVNTIKEFRSYKWQTDNQNKVTNKPIDHMNHAIDALRYCAGYYIRSKGATKSFGSF